MTDEGIVVFGKKLQALLDSEAPPWGLLEKGANRLADVLCLRGVLRTQADVFGFDVVRAVRYQKTFQDFLNAGVEALESDPVYVEKWCIKDPC